ncbi:MAG: PaaI family thioesterase [Actinomycetes bacterium]
MKPDFHNPHFGRLVAKYSRIDINETTLPEGPVTLRGTVDIPEIFLDEHRVLHSGILTTLADIIGGFTCGLASLPLWIVSTDLTISRVKFAVKGPLELNTRVLRVGKSSAVAEVTITDTGADNSLVAKAVVSSALLAPQDGMPERARPFKFAASDPESLPNQRVREFFRLNNVSDDTVSIEITDDLRNPWGIVHGGTTSTLVTATAEHFVLSLVSNAAGESSTGSPLYAQETVLRFLRPGRVGPLIGVARLVGERIDGACVEVTITDSGSEDRVVAEAVVTLRRFREPDPLRS